VVGGEQKLWWETLESLRAKKPSHVVIWIESHRSFCSSFEPLLLCSSREGISSL
jgi:hypothetical protein